LKPGGHMLVFGGTRTYDWMVMALRFAGFECRDQIVYCYGSGFPKSLNISKMIEKQQEVKGDIIGVNKGKGYSSQQEKNKIEGFRPYKNGLPYEKADRNIYSLVSPEAQQWSGWGTNLKPAVELICLCRKPLSEKTIAENVLKHGTGGINIEGTRIGYVSKYDAQHQSDIARGQDNATHGNFFGGIGKSIASSHTPQGRWPANFIHDGSEEVVELFPKTKSGFMKKGTPRLMSSSPNKNIYGHFDPDFVENDTYGDSGSAARFFKACPPDEPARIKYCAKASKSERDFGLDNLPDKLKQTQMRSANGTGKKNFEGGFQDQMMKNTHATVKPLSLCRYLCRLITPPGGTCLDPFMGSGTIGIACKLEDFHFIGIEKEEEYCEIAEARIEAWKIEQQNQLSLEL